MKKWIAVLLASVLAMNLIACDMSSLSEEDIQYVAQILDEASAGIGDEIQNGDLEERWEEFTSNLNLDVINPANLHWEDLTLEDYAALGIDLSDLEDAGLILDDLGLGDLDPSDFDFENLNLIDLQSLGLSDLTLDDLQITIDLDDLDLNPSELFLFFANLDEEDLKEIGLGDLDLTNPDLSSLDLEKIDLSGLEQFLADMGIDPVDLIISNIDPNAIDLNNPMIKDYVLSMIEQEGIDLKALGIDPDKLNLNAIDLNKLGIDFTNLDPTALDLSKLDLSAIDLEKLGIDLKDIDLNNPVIKDYVLRTLEQEGIDLASLGIDLDKLDLNAIDLEALGIDLAHLDPNDLDLNKLDLSAIDLKKLGIDLNDIDLNNPMIKDYVMRTLEQEGIDLESFGINPDKLDLNAIDLDKLGIDLTHLDPNDLDLNKLDLSSIDLKKLGIDLNDIDLNNPAIKDYVVDALEQEGIDLAGLGIKLEDLDLNAIDLDKLGIDLTHIDPNDLDLSKLDLSSIDLAALGIDVNDIDLNNPLIKDYVISTLEQEGIDLRVLGIDPADIDLNAVDFEKLGIDLKHLDLNAFDPSRIDVSALDLESLGLTIDDIDLDAMDLNSPMVLDFIRGALDEQGIDPESFGIKLEEIDFNSPIIKGLILGYLDPDALDLNNLSLESLGIDTSDLSFGDFNLGDVSLSDLGISLDDIDFSDVDLSDLGISLDDIDLGKVDLSDLGLSLDDIDLSDVDLSDLGLSLDIDFDFDLGDVDLSDLGISLDDIDLSDVDLSDLGISLDDIDLSNVDLSDLGISLDDIDLRDIGLDAIDPDALDLSALGIDLEGLGKDLAALDLKDINLEDLGVDLSELHLSDLNLPELDLADLNLDSLDLQDLIPQDLSLEDLNLDNPMVRDYILNELELKDLDLGALDLGALTLDDLSLEALKTLGLDRIDLQDLEAAGLNLDDLNLDDIDFSSLDLSQLTIGDLAAFGITLDDLEAAGLIPADIATGISTLVAGIEEYEAGIRQKAEAAEAEKAQGETEAPAKEEAEENEEAAEAPEEEEEAAEDNKEEGKDAEKEEAAEEEAEEEETSDEAAVELPEEITFLPDRKPAPRDDFYGAIDYDIAENATIETGYSIWDPISELRVLTDGQIGSIVSEAGDAVDESEESSPEYRIGAVYETLMDTEARNEAGVEPVMDWIRAYEKADTMKELLKADLAYIKDTRRSSILSFSSDYDPEDSSRYLIAIDTCLHGPSKEVMTEEGLDDYRDAYLVYLGEIFRAAGYDIVDSVLMGAATYALQTGYEEHTLSYTDQMDASKTTNLFTQDALEDELDNLPIAQWLEAMGLDEGSGYGRYCVADLDALKYLNDIYDEDHLEMLKDNAISTILARYATVLDQKLYDAAMKMNDILAGRAESEPFEKVVASQINTLLPEEVGMIYADRYCSEDTKEQVEDMIDDLKDVYRTMIENNDWMTEETKDKAIEKLERMKAKVAYPDRWYDRSEDATVLSAEDGGTAFDNCVNIQKARIDAEFERAAEKVRRSRWEDVYPQTVNAFYYPGQNTIYICAGILQAPFFDPEADAAANLGGVGFVIGHEMSHAFDATGSQYDAKGNVSNWWTDEDWEAFQDKRKEVEDYYDGVVLIPGTDIHPDGALTVSENMADLGSLKAIEAVCEDDTDAFEQAADSFARCWAAKIRTQALRMRLKTDPHAPAKARVNVPLQMTDLFYETFDVREGDGMYVAPGNRIGIW